MACFLDCQLIIPIHPPLLCITTDSRQGVTGNTITNPIWMVKTRMQLLADGAAGQKAYTGYRDAISRIYRCGVYMCLFRVACVRAMYGRRLIILCSWEQQSSGVG